MKTKTCLVVDSSRVQRTFTRTIAENLAFACREAADSNAAISACAFTMPNVILLDWDLPGLAGGEFLKAIRAIPGGDRPKIIVCSGSADIDDILQSLEQGADEYLMKPFDQDIVRSKFEQIGLI